MGCDIHMYVEAKDEDDDGNDFWDLVMTERAAYGDRNYAAFAVLAGVRNSFGLTPIAEPRGLPADAHPEVKKRSAKRGLDGHSHSWLTLSEVLDYGWLAGTTVGNVPDHALRFLAWAKSLKDGPTRLNYRRPEEIRLVFWFDN